MDDFAVFLPGKHNLPESVCSWCDGGLIDPSLADSGVIIECCMVVILVFIMLSC